MPLIATKGKQLSAVLTAESINSLVFNFNYQTTTANETAATTYALGEVLIYDTTTDKFRRILDADVANLPITSEDSILRDGADLCVFIGDGTGIGRGAPLSVAATTDTTVSVAFRGPLKLVEQGLVFETNITEANQAIIVKALEKQGLQVDQRADQVAVSFH